MKKIILTLLLLMPMCIIADNCKPDVETKDKISKQEIKAWQCKLNEEGWLSITELEWKIMIQFGRYGTSHCLFLFLEKREESMQRASFESKFKGEKGKDFLISFTNGTPMRFIASSATNKTQMDNGAGALVTSIVLGTTLTNKQIKEFKSNFESGNVSAIRLAFAGDASREEFVKEKKAERIKEKFNCFNDFITANPIVEIDKNNLPPNPNVPEVLPRDANTNKVSFTEAIPVDGTTKDQLYNRAKSWMTSYYKNEQFSINSKEDGRITREGFFRKTYLYASGTTRELRYNYTLSIFIKDGKYKYEITDLANTAEDGKGWSIDVDYEASESLPKFTKYMNQQIYEGVDVVIKSLKAAMLVDAKSSSDW